MFWQSKPTKKIKAFEDWCLDDDPKYPKSAISGDAIRATTSNRNISGDKLHREYIKAIANAKDVEEAATVDIKDLDNPIDLKFSDLPPWIEERQTFLWRISARNRTTLHITNERVHLLVVNGARKIHLENCWIGKLRTRSSEFSRPTLILKNCWIGQFVMDTKSIDSLSMVDGRVESISCPAPDGDNPLTGSVTISPNVIFATSPNSRLLTGAQGYRSLRSHLEKLQNAPAANLVRVKELRTERHFGEESAFNRAINWIYDGFSEYGNSPGRPLMLILGTYVLVALVLFQFDGVSLGLEEENYHGWQRSLCEAG